MSIAWISTALRSTHHNTGNLRAGKALRGDDPCAHARNTICSTRCARASPLTRLRRVHRRSDRCAVFRSHVIGAQQHRRNRSIVNMKCIPSMAMAGLLIALTPGMASPQSGTFRIEEATISDMHRAIQAGQITCAGVVQAYIDRAKAYNGTCTALVTKDGAPIPPAVGSLRAGVPLTFPTQTVPVSKVLPDFDQYAGPPIEFG